MNAQTASHDELGNGIHDMSVVQVQFGPRRNMKPYDNPELERLAQKMFRQFARMEYALKAAGYLCKEPNAKADWASYAETIDDAMSDPRRKEVTIAINFLMTHPPRKQIVRDGLIEWDDAPPHHKSNTDLLLLYVRRVRNNLFHGGKFNSKWFAPERSERLLQSSLTVLDYCLELSPEVKKAYDN